MRVQKSLCPKKILGNKFLDPKKILVPKNFEPEKILGPQKYWVPGLLQQCSMSLVTLKVANGSIAQHMGTILARSGPARSTCDYNALLQLPLPTGKELGNNILLYNTVLCLKTYNHFMK